jgi:NADPH:quinone reductase-like Zn-dependent oxidoreductase
MKAVFQERYGSPAELELRDVPAPAVGDEDVLVRVRAASLHPDVWHVVSGRPFVLRLMGAGLFRPKNPIPGTDMAGVVEAVGRSVAQFEPGDEVFGETVRSNVWAHGGAFAEQVSVPQDQLAIKPGNVTFEQAAAVPTSGFIALQCFRDPSQVRPEGRVLVNGAGGGVGALALQFIKAHGAHVTAVDSTRKLGLLRALGADEVIDYRQEDFTRRGERYDLIFDVPGNHPFAACRRALEPTGKYLLIGHEGFGASGHRVFGLLPLFFKLMFLARFVEQLPHSKVPLLGRKEIMAVLRDHLAAGTITPVIDSTYPLSEARAALRHMVEAETRGKVIITV